jgi:CheY-like chemotaxis protein
MTTVVLADADDERRAAQAFGLRSGGCEVTEVETLESALTAVARERPDALVLAAELCRAVSPQRLVAALRAQPETAAIHTVLVAAVGSAVDTTGIDTVLSRPTTPVDLVAAVTAHSEVPVDG